MKRKMETLATPVKGIFIERDNEEPRHPGDERDAFQHDRDRVLHSTAFRRLQYKTQVYMIHEGDMYRTRMTHTLEVAQIARGLAQQLRVNCDLAEAIALAHDIGHPPFGHAGEEKLRHLLKPHCIPFNHNIQSYRVLSRLEERYNSFSGLNLTHAVYEGILRHNTYFDNQEEVKASITNDIKQEVSKYWNCSQPGIEAQIVNMADIIAYAAHDIEDALGAGLIAWEDFKEKVKENNAGFVSDLMCKAEAKVKKVEGYEEWASKVRPRILANSLINKLIIETQKQTAESISRLNSYNEKRYEQIRKLENKVVALPPPLESQVTTLVGEILLNHVYKDPRVMIMVEKAKTMLDLLFKTFMQNSKTLPRNTQARLRREEELFKRGESKLSKDEILPTVVADYISGMTDKYAMDLYQLLTQPYEKAL